MEMHVKLIPCLSFSGASLVCFALALAATGCVEDAPAKLVEDAGSKGGSAAGSHGDSHVDAGRDGGSEPDQVRAALLPWKEGNTWTYRVTDNDEVSEKVTTIGPEEMVGGDGPHSGDTAFKVVTKKGAMDQTLSWQRDIDGRVVRLREQSFGAKTGELQLEEYWDPYKLHIDGTDEHLQAGAKWVEVYDETKVEPGMAPSTSTERDAWSVDTLSESVTVPAGTFDAIVLVKAGGSNLKTYWYVPGIGKIKETGGQTEELVSYEVAP
jgi:hypothetical protein